MDPKEAVTLANQYGISTVLCILVIGILVWVLKWVFDTSQRREQAMAQIITVGLQGLTTSMNELAKTVGVNTGAIAALQHELKEANRYVRDEHAAQLRNQERIEGKLEAGLERLTDGGGCKAA